MKLIKNYLIDGDILTYDELEEGVMIAKKENCLVKILIDKKEMGNAHPKGIVLNPNTKWPEIKENISKYIDIC